MKFQKLETSKTNNFNFL